MKENKEDKRNNKKRNLILIIILIILFVIAVGVIIMFAYKTNMFKEEKYEKSNKIEEYELEPWEGGGFKKPIIYLYPEEKKEVSIIAKYPEKFTHTYPKYEDSWNVIAESNGTLYNNKDGRELYSLYYEGINDSKPNMSEGFCVKGEDTIEFLEDKLEKLGLNARESEEFIVYWLPILEENKYNYIHFLTTEEVEEIMPLEITPEPDTRIRILMEYKALDKQIHVKEQQIEIPERNGFVMVEWGGTEINKKIYYNISDSLIRYTK